LEVWLGHSARDSGRSREIDRRSPEVRIEPRRSHHPPAGGAHGEAPCAADHINQVYDRIMYSPFVREYYGYSDFQNLGYWTKETYSQKQACLNLMEELLRFLPDKDGTILDVACGMGASTLYLLDSFDPSRVTGINISEKQLASCRAKAPGCQFLLMDATRLEFPDESFRNILCVEAAFHFNSREQFLREAFRVLERGGHLALADILFKNPEAEASRPTRNVRNFLPGPRAYADLLRAIGFADVVVLDRTRECPVGFQQHLKNYLRQRLRLRPSERSSLRAMYRVVASDGVVARDIRYYLLVSARRP
jgi:SAM-dependent methyltransferase